MECYLAQSGSAPLNFDVKAYGSEELLLAARPKENTIGIVTTTPIPAWYFRFEQPDAPVEGMAWIVTSTSNSYSFNALKKNGIQVYPLSAKQYVSGAWVDKTAKSYQGGEWVDWWHGELYDAGNEYEVHTGGWSVDGYTPTSGSIRSATKEADYMYFEGASNVTTLLGTMKPINVDNFKTLYIDGEPISIYNNELSVGFSISPTKKQSDRINAGNFPGKTGRQTISLDVSSVSGDIYIMIYGHATASCKGKVYRVWLE